MRVNLRKGAKEMIPHGESRDEPRPRLEKEEKEEDDRRREEEEEDDRFFYDD